MISCTLAVAVEKNAVNDSQKIVNTIKEVQIDKFLTSSPQLTKCKKENKDTDALSKCFSTELSKYDSKQLSKIGDELKLSETHGVDTKNKKMLIDFFSKRIETQLYGKSFQEKPSAKLAATIDQSRFTEIYHSIVTKNILLEVAEFCLANHKRDNTNQADYIKENYQTMIDQVNNQPDYFKQQISECLLALPTQCDEYEKNTANDGFRKGCLLHQKFRNYKVVLKQIENDKKFWQELKKNPTFVTTVMKSPDENFDIHKVINYGSTDITEGALGNKLAKENEDFKTKCLTKSSAECEALVQKGNKEALEELRARYVLEQQLQMKNLDSMDSKKLREWAIKYMGYSEERLKELERDPQGMNAIIKKKYEIEQNALIAEIQEKIEKYGLSKDKSLQDSQEILNNIGSEVENREEVLKLIVRYNNIINNYFNVKLGKEEGTNYSAPLAHEVNALERSNSKIDQQDLPWIKNISQQGTIRSPGSASSISLKAEQLDLWLGENQKLD